MILYINTSDSTKTIVGLEKDGKKFLLSEKTGKQKSQNVLPLIKKLLEKHNASPQKLTDLIVNTGPGSFTGLRIGIAVANTLGYILSIPVNKKKIVEPVYSKSKFDY